MFQRIGIDLRFIKRVDETLNYCIYEVFTNHHFGDIDPRLDWCDQIVKLNQCSVLNLKMGRSRIITE